MKKTAVKKSKHVRLLESLMKGKTFTVSQIRSQFKSGNPYDVVAKLRKMGVDVKTTERNNKTVYQLDNV